MARKNRMTILKRQKERKRQERARLKREKRQARREARRADAEAEGPAAFDEAEHPQPGS